MQRLPTLDEIDRELARRSLYEFLLQAWPNIEPGTPLVLNWHIKTLCDEVQALLEGDSPRQNLCLNVPPGSMKSSIVSVCATAWMWLARPEWTVLFVSGADDVAIRDSMKCRTLITSEWYQGFGIRWRLAKDQDAKGWFRNTAGGERQATTIGSKVTGKRAHAVFFDDPNDTKDVSSVKLDAVTMAYSQAFQNRLKDMQTGITCLIQQRTHMVDLTGYVMTVDPESWRHVVIRQRFEVGDPQKHPDDPRTEAGELLFPARFPARVVDREEKLLLAVGFAGQHQQRPIPKEGATFKIDMISIIESAPAGMTLCRGWDPASSQGKGDFTVGALLGAAPDGSFVIVDVVRVQTGEPRRLCKQVAQLDGYEVPIDWPQDPGQAGKDQVQSMVRDFAGWVFRTSPETGAKETRWEPFASQVNGGNVKMVRAPWNRVILDEMSVAPRGANDDFLDAAARAFKRIASGIDPWLEAVAPPPAEVIRAQIEKENAPAPIHLPAQSIIEVVDENELPDWM